MPHERAPAPAPSQEEGGASGMEATAAREATAGREVAVTRVERITVQVGPASQGDPDGPTVPSELPPDPAPAVATDVTLLSPPPLGAGEVTLVAAPDAERPPASAAAPSLAAPGTRSFAGLEVDGRYVIEAPLGEGGMGIVYRARRTVLDKPVALKVLRADLASDRELVERFTTEARSASAIGNPHIVDVIDVGTLPDGATYFVMEFLEGRSLSQVIDHERPLSVERLVRLALQLCDGLSAAHSAGIVHRDLKPDNVFVLPRDGEDFVKILDFGVAKVAGQQSRQTRAGTIVGTPHYMAPEQARGDVVDRRADVYAVGVILFELVTGQVPFEAESPLAVLTQHLTKEPPTFAAVGAGPVPAGLESVVRRCLEKDPADRYPDMPALAEDLGALLRGERTAAEARTARAPARPAAERRGAPWAAVGLGALGLGAAALAVTPWAAAWSMPAIPLVVPAVVEQAERLEVPRPLTAVPGRAVALVLSPIDAEVFRDGVSLGTMPISITIPPGGRAVVEVRREGYATRRVVLTGAEPRVRVSLEVRRGGAVPGATAAPGPTPDVPDLPEAVDEVPPPTADDGDAGEDELEPDGGDPAEARPAVSVGAPPSPAVAASAAPSAAPPASPPGSAAP